MVESHDLGAAPVSLLQSQLRLGKEHDTLATDVVNLEPSNPLLHRQSSRSPTSQRPWSSCEPQPALSPSPSFYESAKTSKDDIHVPTPVTPRRPSLAPRGLSLQMPTSHLSSTSTASSTNPIPLSPKPDISGPYTSPGSVLPRRSRGLDFSRACTNLHHSTLAEQSSPDSSPVIGGRGIMIPPRKAPYSNMNIVPDSPGIPNSLWTTMVNADRPGVASSVGSINMMDSDPGSSSSGEDDIMGQVDDDDGIHTYTRNNSIANGAVNNLVSRDATSLTGDGIETFPGAIANLRSYQIARLKTDRSRKRSSSASGRSSHHSPGPASPPLFRSESSLGNGYFRNDPTKKDIESRRQSLSLGTIDLNISDAVESDESRQRRSSPSELMMTPVTPTMDERRNVIRRAVTRRGNMLPKSKNFARIRAALQEESAPIDTEVRREAEVIRQVRESDNDQDISLLPSQPATTASSPNLRATTIGRSESVDEMAEDETTSSASSGRRSSNIFSYSGFKHAGSTEFWNRFDDRMRTPPPSYPRGSSSGISDDINMDTPMSSVSMTPQQGFMTGQHPTRSRSSTPQPVAAELPQILSKRRREDDFDSNYFKRRAVSPGVSLQNSPIVPQSPLQKEGGCWGLPSKANRETAVMQPSVERACSGESSISTNGKGPVKRVGFQGMNDTNDGLMNMSIE